MRILVTGSSGKLGRAVVAELAGAPRGQAPHDLVLFDRDAGATAAGVRQVVGDVTDLPTVMSAAEGAEAIVHLAAIRRWGIAPNDVTFRTNVMGTFNVHEAAATLGIRRVVSTSSIAVLGWDYRERDFLPDYLPIDEDHELRPQDAYGLSKVVGEQIARAFTDRSAIETVVLRPPWIATPEELTAVHAAGGRPAPRFDTYAYVDTRDAADAYRRAVERPLTGHHVLFIAADDSVIAKPLAETLPALLPGLGTRAATLIGARSFVSNDRARAILGWAPRFGWRSPASITTPEPV